MSKKDKVQLTVIWGLALLLGIVLVVGFHIYINTPVNAQQAPKTCPAGSYDIGITKDGDPICKLEPTGCPFGDSVPMDKCQPPADIECNADWSHCVPKAIQPAPVVEEAPVESAVDTGCGK